MHEDDFKELAKLRIERALELTAEAQELLNNESYKSANNRAYYAIEKSLAALLATIGIQTQTHKGCLLQFNLWFVQQENNDFSINDYKIAAKAEKIRNASDYDDFYIADKNETREQVENSIYFCNKVKDYLKTWYNPG